jgi:hypothetical protein
VADIVEPFCAVELYLPDAMHNAMSLWRPSSSWSCTNWCDEESKHSLA